MRLWAGGWRNRGRGLGGGCGRGLGLGLRLLRLGGACAGTYIRYFVSAHKS